MMDVERAIKYISRSTPEMTEILPLVFFLVAGPLICQSFLNIFSWNTEGGEEQQLPSYMYICWFLLVVLFDW